MYDGKYEHHKPFKELTSTEQHRQLRRLEACGIPCFSCSWLGWGGGVSDVRGFPYVALKNAYIEILCVYFIFHGFLLVENWGKRTWILRLGTRNSLPKFLTWKMRKRSSSPNLNRCSYLTSSKTRTLSKKEMNYKLRFQSHNY